MKYEKVVKGCFLERPNRFIAYVEIDNNIEKCHVKNTGRCRELLKPGATVYLERNDNPSRSTRYSLVAAKKEDRLINIDSQAPNQVVKEWLKDGNLFPMATLIRPEYTYGSSRFDFYIEVDARKILMEVKGVTLEEDGVVRFPDAPTKRGVKHIYELCEALKHGYDSYLLFVIQMKDVKYFTPNTTTHKEFQEAMVYAWECGVKILAYDCIVTKDQLALNNRVDIRLSE